MPVLPDVDLVLDCENYQMYVWYSIANVSKCRFGTQLPVLPNVDLIHN